MNEFDMYTIDRNLQAWNTHWDFKSQDKRVNIISFGYNDLQIELIDIDIGYISRCHINASTQLKWMKSNYICSNPFKTEFTIVIFIHYKPRISGGWKWPEVGGKRKKFIVIIKLSHEHFCSKTHRFLEN